MLYYVILKKFTDVEVEKIINNIERISYNIVDGGKPDLSFEKELDLVAKRLCLKYDYYDLLRYWKRNDRDEFIWLGSTKSVKVFDYRKIDSSLNTVLKGEGNIGGLAMLSCNRPIIVINDFLVNVDIIIHEINHLISKEKLVILCDDEMKVVGEVECFGIDPSRSIDFIDEIINEFMTRDILDIFINLCDDRTKSNILLDYSDYCVYPKIDQASFGVVSSIYEVLKSDIKCSLVTGMGKRIKKIIGEDNYNDLNNFLYRNYEKMLSCRSKGYIVESGGEKSKEANKLKSNFQKAYSDYLDYSLSLDKYVDNLVDGGKARKVK